MSLLRKISVLLLAPLMLLSLFSCTGPYPELREYNTALSGGTPISATVKSSLDTELGLLFADYTATWQGGTVTVDYTKDKLAELAPGSSPDSVLTAVTGTAVIAADGTVTGDIGSVILSLLTRDITLDGEKITYTEAEGTLTFTVTKENTEAVLGVALGYDVSCAVTLSEKNVSSITLSYTADSGEARVECEFEY